jgi:hypothetical protein
MPDWIDTPNELMAVLSILGVVIAVIVFIVDSRVNRMYREMKPNGGSSLRDAVDRIERKIDSHIQWHLEDDK